VGQRRAFAAAAAAVAAADDDDDWKDEQKSRPRSTFITVASVKQVADSCVNLTHTMLICQSSDSLVVY